MIQILNNQYPIGWEWVANIPINQILFFYELMATVTDNTDIYRSLQCEREASYSQEITLIYSADRIELAKFLNNDQGYEEGIKYHIKWILATNVLHCTNMDEYMANINEIERLSRLNLGASEG
jgi:hypothetical protein